MPEEEQFEPGFNEADADQIEIDPLKMIEKQMDNSNVDFERKGDEFFSETPAGDIPVRLPTDHEALYYQADEVGQREAEVKRGLEETGADLDEKIAAARKTLRDNQEAYKHSESAEEILRRLKDQGDLLVSDVRIDDLDFIPGGAVFVTNKKNISGIEKAFKQKGYGVKRILNKGLAVTGPFASYNFLETAYEKKLKDLLIEEDGGGSEDFDDETLKGGKTTTGKQSKIPGKRSIAKKLGKAAGSVSKGQTIGKGGRTPASSGQAGKEAAQEDLNELVTGATPVAIGNASAFRDLGMVKPDQPSAGPEVGSGGAAAPAEAGGAGAGGIGGIGTTGL